MSDENTETTTAEGTEGAAETEKKSGSLGPPPARGIPSKNLGHATRPGFRDPANKRTKAQKKKRKKK